LQEVVGDKWQSFYAKSPALQGALQIHQFDAGIANGRTYIAARGLSFEGPATRDASKEVEATAWAIDDIRQTASPPKLAVIALPPRRSSKLFDEANHVFTSLGTEVVPEDEAHDWAVANAAAVSR